MSVLVRSNQTINDPQWYAIRVRSRYEKRVYRDLKDANYTVSLPLISMSREWSDRRKLVELPLFRGYVFVKIHLHEAYYPVLQTGGVVQFVGHTGRPIPIPSQQMYWLDLILSQGNITPRSQYPRGSEVKVTHGPLYGLQGTVLNTKSQSRLVVWFDAIMQGLEVEIDQTWLMPLSNKNLTYL